MPRQLKLLFCEQFGCPAAEYVNRAFHYCLYSHAKPVAPLLLKVNPAFFTEDFKFIADLGHATGMQEAKADSLNFSDANGGPGNFWRRSLKLRVSGRKAMRLAHDLFSQEHQKQSGERMV
jgi:hypothetical protein